MWYNTIENYKNMRGIDMNFLYNRKKTAIIYNDIEYSYRDVINSAKCYSSLISIEKDERVVIFTENRPEFIYAFFAIWDKEGIAVNIDGSYEVEQVAYVLKDSDPKYIFGIYLLISIISAISKYAGGPVKYNNYMIFKNVFTNTLAQRNIYLQYPEIHFDSLF